MNIRTSEQWSAAVLCIARHEERYSAQNGSHMLHLFWSLYPSEYAAPGHPHKRSLQLKAATGRAELVCLSAAQAAPYTTLIMY